MKNIVYLRPPYGLKEHMTHENSSTSLRRGGPRQPKKSKSKGRRITNPSLQRKSRRKKEEADGAKEGIKP